VAMGLLDCGYEKGDRLAVWMHSNSEWLILQLATSTIGVILVNLNPAYTAPEVRHALQDVACKGLVLSRRDDDADAVVARGRTTHYATLHDAIPELRAVAEGRDVPLTTVPSLEHVFVIQKEDQRAALRKAGSIIKDFDHLREAGAAVPHARLVDAESRTTCTEPSGIQFSSGTTGRPKASVLTHHNVLNNGYFVGRNLGVTEHDTFCIPVPLFHCFGMVLGNLAALSNGSSIVYPSAKFDAVAVLDAVEKYRCTVLHGVPTMFIRLGAEQVRKVRDVGSLRTGIMAGSVCPIEVLRRVRDELVPEIVVNYGQTETSPVSFATRIGIEAEKQVTTVGTIMPHTEAKVVREDGTTADVGESGELYVRGYLVMKGYWNDPEKTRSTITPDGWLKSGDLVSIDREGYARVVGRAKDVIIKGGENIFPTQIEDTLHAHPAVEDVSVVSVPSTEFGEEVCAWVMVKKGQELSEEDVRDAVRQKLAYYNVPKYVILNEEFPVTVNGKHQKNIMRERSPVLLGLTNK